MSEGCHKMTYREFESEMRRMLFEENEDRIDEIWELFGHIAKLLEITDVPGGARRYLTRMIEEEFGADPEKKRRFKRSPIPQSMRWEVFARDDFTCKECGSRKLLEADHIHPVSKGGPTTLDNLQTLCRRCNGRKSDRVPDKAGARE